MKNTQGMTPREVYQQRIKTARVDLLLMLVLTVVNVVLYFTGSSTMMLFSASVPYYAVVFADMLRIPTATAIFYAIAGVSVLAYFLCWLLSKKRHSWLIVATVLFALDFLALIGLYIYAGETGGLIDLVIHGFVLYYLILGAVSVVKIKSLPAEVPVQAEPGERVDSTPIRRAQEEGKFRVLLEEQYGNHRVCYRRVKKCNQLVINGYIYDEVEFLVEPPHSLTAVVEGHLFEVGNDGNFSYFSVDGNLIKKKLRLY